MGSNRTAGLNYEAEYNRLLEEHKKLCAELDYKNQLIKEKEDSLSILNAQMNVVHLIFGRNY